MNEHKNIRVRFAPSPTGHLHIGGIRSAIFNWLFARHTGGSYLLRVEDTDVARSTPEYVQSQLASLAWMGLLPDEPLIFQMSRLEAHVYAACMLMEKGLAYPCFCPPRDAETVVHDLEQGFGSKYDGTCRNKAYTEHDLQQPHAVRFKLPSDLQTVTFQDLVLGAVTVDAQQLDDYIIIRRDGTPIYNFCVVVDDIFMKITHVIRGQDHVSNTPKQVLLYRALGFQEPLFAHIPLILGPDGGKLSKRDAAVSVEEYRLQGYLPDALFNYLVRLGWSHGDQEIFTKDELIALFTLENVGKKGSIFDVKKLQWLNALYMRQTAATDLLAHLKALNPAWVDHLLSLWSAQQLHRLIDEYKQRAVTLVDLYQAIAAFAVAPATRDSGLIAKWRSEKTVPMLQSLIDQLQQANADASDAISAIAHHICQASGVTFVALAQPVRLALVGSLVSPGVCELISILGKEKSIERIEVLIKELS